jgi:hypothetical protein
MNTGKLGKLHNLYDHNVCFFSHLLDNENEYSFVEPKYTMKQAALEYIKVSELKLLKQPTLDMFPDEKCFNVFNTRCEQLGITLVEQSKVCELEKLLEQNDVYLTVDEAVKTIVGGLPQASRTGDDYADALRAFDGWNKGRKAFFKGV